MQHFFSIPLLKDDELTILVSPIIPVVIMAKVNNKGSKQMPQPKQQSELNNQLDILKAAIDNPNFKLKHKALYWRCRGCHQSLLDIKQAAIMPNSEFADELAATLEALATLNLA